MGTIAAYYKEHTSLSLGESADRALDESKADFLDKFEGAMVGGVIGDAFGRVFASRPESVYSVNDVPRILAMFHAENRKV